MCCLKYENEVYQEKLKKLPKVGTIVKTPDGEGTVEMLETLKEQVKVKIPSKDSDEYSIKKYDVKDIKVIKELENSENEEN